MSDSYGRSGRLMRPGESPTVGEKINAWSPKHQKAFNGVVAAIAPYETTARTGIAVAILFEAAGFVVVTDARKLFAGGGRSTSFLSWCTPDMQKMPHATLTHSYGRGIPDPATVMEGLE